jgi:hypothetical protein
MAIYFDLDLKQAHGATRDASCSQCGKKQSFWTLGRQPICSPCVLYRSRWGEDAKDKLLVFIQEIEDRVGVSMPRDSSGVLESVADANRILFAIVASHHVLKLRNAAARGLS